MRERLLKILQGAVERSVTPGAVVALGTGNEEPTFICAGATAWEPKHAQPVTSETVYDVASLTKPMGCAAVAMVLHGRGYLDLGARVNRWIDELAGPGTETMEVVHLLGHSSGFPAHVNLYEMLLRTPTESPRQQLLGLAAATPLVYSPGDKTIYSDLGYIVLGFVLERVGKRRLDGLVRSLLTEPLHMTATDFVDLQREPRFDFGGRVIAPTEVCPRRGYLLGAVHDDNAHAAGGITGHAGMFSTAADVARFARGILDALGGDTRVFSPASVKQFVNTSASVDTTWRLGWDRPDPRPGVSHAGDVWPRNSFGHLGFTGCSLWIDPIAGRYAALLTNRVHPNREASGAYTIFELRREVMDLAAGA